MIYLEGELLDDWRLDDWLEALYRRHGLSGAHARYADGLLAGRSLFLINDDRFRMESRVKRLKKRTAHSNFPIRRPSICSQICASPTRTRQGHMCMAYSTSRAIVTASPILFLGRLRYHLVKQGDTVLIRYKRCDLGVDELVPQGRLAIIL